MVVVDSRIARGLIELGRRDESRGVARDLIELGGW